MATLDLRDVSDEGGRLDPVVAVEARVDHFDADGTRPIAFDELDQPSRAGNVVLVDVRPACEFAAGHVDAH